MPVRFRVTTPRSRPAALATIDLVATDAGELDAVLVSVCSSVVRPGRIGLRSLAGADEGLLVRASPTHATLMPHGGPAVLELIARSLQSAGCAPDRDPDPRALYPEAESDVEAAVLAALAVAPSPLAVDLLLDQPRRWAGKPWQTPGPRDLRLRRLITPPLVAVVGPPNVGKSSLLNALAGREAAVVHDAAGTTRDHVGAMIDLAGLVVRWADTPGRRDATGVERAAIEASLPLDHRADLLVAMGDATSDDPRALAAPTPVLVVAGRADLGTPSWSADLAVSAKTGAGIPELVRTLRAALVPDADLQAASPWVFCDDPAIGPG